MFWIFQNCDDVLFAGTVWAQQAQLSGFVKDPSGALVARAAITIQNLSTNGERSTKTDDSGSYTFPLLSPGTYQLTSEAPGFEKRIVQL